MEDDYYYFLNEAFQIDPLLVDPEKQQEQIQEQSPKIDATSRGISLV